MKINLFIVFLAFSVLNAKAQYITTVVGNGIQGYSGLGGPAVSAEIWNPLSVIEDNNGNLYITGTAMVWKVKMAPIDTW